MGDGEQRRTRAAHGVRDALLSAPVPSRRVLRWFALYLGRYMPRHFHALRVAEAERWPHGAHPLLVCVNHASWWDPMVCIQLSRILEPSAAHYAPMDAEALGRYQFLRRLGLFPVEQGSTRGANQFLRIASALLARRGTVLWLTPQGAFVDVRERPVVFRAGLGVLLRRLEHATVVPLALEYTFWNERLPEALAMLGRPLYFENGVLQGAPAEAPAGEAVAAALAQTQDELALLAMTRDAGRFAAVVSGRQGTGGVYGLWQRILSFRRGDGWHPEHGTARGTASGDAGSKSDAPPA